MKVKHAFSILVVAASCAGCVPIAIPDTPNIHGKVIDAMTKAPVVGAEVALRDVKNGTLLVVHSSSDGKFVASKIEHTAWLPLAYDVVLPPISAEISAAGYVPAKLTISQWREWADTIELSPTAAKD